MTKYIVLCLGCGMELHCEAKDYKEAANKFRAIKRHYPLAVAVFKEGTKEEARILAYCYEVFYEKDFKERPEGADKYEKWWHADEDEFPLFLDVTKAKVYGLFPVLCPPFDTPEARHLLGYEIEGRMYVLVRDYGEV